MFNLGLTSSQLDRLTGHIFTHCTSSDPEPAANPAKPTSRKSIKSTATAGGKLHVQDFLKHLTVVYKQSQTATDKGGEADAWAIEALERIGRLILKTPQDELIAEDDVTEAALKIQALYRGMAARKDVEQVKADPSAARKSQSDARKSHADTRSTKKSIFQLDPDAIVSGETVASELTNKMMTLFQALDKSGDGVLQIEEFVTGIEKLKGLSDLQLSDGRQLDRDTLLAMAKVIDVTGNGDINYLEFLKAFSVDDAGQSDIAETLGEDITTTLFRHRHAIRMGCHYLDEEASGYIRSQDFETVLHGVNSALSGAERKLTTLQISLLVEAMSSEAAKGAMDEQEEQSVDYEFFLKSFQIIDLQKDRQVVKTYG
jgi:Ca2+-binding EF-hand superfamily protein